MLNKKILLPLFILLTAVWNSFGQNKFIKGYIVTLENDTIHGLVKQRSDGHNYKSCIFKDAQHDIEYFPNQIKGFGYIYNDKFFISQIIEGTFVEALVLGEISLFKFKGQYYIKKGTTLYNLESNVEEVKDNNGVTAEIRDNSRWRGILAYLISDCIPNSSKHVSTISRGERSLIPLIAKYHTCKGTTFTEFKTSKPWTKFEFGVTSGVSISNARTTGNAVFLDKSYLSVDPTIGLLLSGSFPRTSERIALQAELHIFHSSYSSKVDFEYPIRGYSTSSFEMTTLTLPFSLKYIFPERKFGFYLQGGIHYDHNVRTNSSTRVTEIYEDHESLIYEGKAFSISKGIMGYWCGMGIQRSIIGYRASIAVRYYFTSLFEEFNFNVSNNRVALNLIFFKK